MKPQTILALSILALALAGCGPVASDTTTTTYTTTTTAAAELVRTTIRRSVWAWWSSAHAIPRRHKHRRRHNRPRQLGRRRVTWIWPLSAIRF